MARPQLGKAASRASDAVTRSDSTADGCCRLSAASTTSLKLSPYGGNTLWVGGQACTIPSAGVTLAGQTSLAASTLYYVYATATGGAINALLLSTTGHITGADGREYLSNGAQTPAAVTTSRLVGMAYTNTAAAPFLDSATFRGVANFFNRRNRQVTNSYGSQIGTTSTTYVQYAQINTVALFWSDEDTIIFATGAGTVSVSGNGGNVSFWIDGSQTGYGLGQYFANANAGQDMTLATPVTLSEGPHNVTLAVASSSSSSTFYVNPLYIAYVTRI